MRAERGSLCGPGRGRNPASPRGIQTHAVLRECAAPQTRRLRPPSITYKIPAKPRLTYVGDEPEIDVTTVGRATAAVWARQLRGANGLRRLPPITVPDALFAERLGVEFGSSRAGIRVAELNDLFEKVGFARRDPDRLRVALDGTHRMVYVRVASSSSSSSSSSASASWRGGGGSSSINSSSISSSSIGGSSSSSSGPRLAPPPSQAARPGQLVGFARATSDGHATAIIWDVAVAPAWQRVGLGRALMERLTRGLVADGVPRIALYSEPSAVDLYRRLGFRPDDDGGGGGGGNRDVGGDGGAKSSTGSSSNNSNNSSSSSNHNSGSRIIDRKNVAVGARVALASRPSV